MYDNECSQEHEIASIPVDGSLPKKEFLGEENENFTMCHSVAPVERALVTTDGVAAEGGRQIGNFTASTGEQQSSLKISSCGISSDEPVESGYLASPQKSRCRKASVQRAQPSRSYSGKHLLEEDAQSLASETTADDYDTSGDFSETEVTEPSYRCSTCLLEAIVCLG